MQKAVFHTRLANLYAIGQHERALELARDISAS